ncbi:MAG: proline dehydrogenase family protein [Armatimonadota bacterium]
MDPSPAENRVREDALALLAAVRHQERAGRPADLLLDAVMGLATKDDRTKVELFRFVDALPALHSGASVARHLREYLLDPGLPLPAGAGGVLRTMVDLPVAHGPLRLAASVGAGIMARRFIAGRDARGATGAIERLRAGRMGFTMDLLGEAVISDDEADAYQGKYLDLVDGLAERAARWKPDPRIDSAPFGPVPSVNVSVKLSSLYPRFDPMAADATVAGVGERLRPILRRAHDRGVFVNFDMEQHDFAATTRRIFREIASEADFAGSPHLGIVVQAYLKDAEGHCEELRDFARARGVPITIRLVKGAYWDYETIVAAQRGHRVPVWERKPETDACFERCVDFLVSQHAHLRPAIASHNVRSAAYARSAANAAGLAPGTLEYQVLYGMGEPIGRALSASGERVRVYVPFGELLPGMAYLVRRLLENSSNDSFVRKAGAQVADDELVSSPAERLARAAVPAAPTPVERFMNEPETDFAEPAAQVQMREALAAVETQLGATVPLHIAGVDRLEGRLVDREDPSHAGVVASRAYYATPAHADEALAAAARAFPAWRDTHATERAALLRRVADIFVRRRFEMAAWMVREVGKPWREADADVAEAIDFCRFYADEMERIAEPRRRDVPGEWNAMHYDARGPAVVIAPWNFPLAILVGMATAALVAGNPVVLKPAEQSSRVGWFLMEALREAGCPPGVAQFLTGDGAEIGPGLVADPRVALIAFTGSRAVGLDILKSASEVRPGQREIKRVIAELGGKNAMIIDDDADLDEAVLAMLHSAIGFAGQKCSACSRVIVIGDAWNAFRERLATAVRTIHIGPADDPATTLPPVVDAEARDRVLRYAEIAEREGRLLARTDPPADCAGCYVPAVFVEDVPIDGHLFQEEVFGPVVALVRARDLDEALAIADSTPYALTGVFHSRSPAHIERARREFRVGNLYINRKITGALVDRQPFGGARMSGIGSKAGSPDYLLQFLVPRTITESVLRRGFAPEDAG